MKTIKIVSFLIFSLSLAAFSFAGEIKTETIKVFGNCGMCKSRIEKAAKGAGADSADWSTETKMLTIRFNDSSSDAAKIQQAIAAVGHDTRDFKAPDEVYDKLPGCCKYERAKPGSVAMQTMNSEKCSADKMSTTGMGCCKEGNSNKVKAAPLGQQGNQPMMNGKDKKEL